MISKDNVEKRGHCGTLWQEEDGLPILVRRRGMCPRDALNGIPGVGVDLGEDQCHKGVVVQIHGLGDNVDSQRVAIPATCLQVCSGCPHKGDKSRPSPRNSGVPGPLQTVCCAARQWIPETGPQTAGQPVTGHFSGPGSGLSTRFPGHILIVPLQGLEHFRECRAKFRGVDHHREGVGSGPASANENAHGWHRHVGISTSPRSTNEKKR